MFIKKIIVIYNCWKDSGVVNDSQKDSGVVNDCQKDSGVVNDCWEDIIVMNDHNVQLVNDRITNDCCNSGV